MILPVSSVLLERQAEYGEELRTFTGPLLPFVEWVSTEKPNVRVLNDTADLYRFGDYTEITEFLYDCVVTTIEPREIEYLARFNEAKGRIQSFIEMPDTEEEAAEAVVRDVFDMDVPADDPDVTEELDQSTGPGRG